MYVITSRLTGRRYVGKKRLRLKRTRPPLKGKKRKRVERVESDWRDYWGSSKNWLTEVERDGRVYYDREIVRLCRTPGEASYYEAKIQFAEDALLKPDEWANEWIMVRVRRDHLMRKKT